MTGVNEFGWFDELSDQELLRYSRQIMLPKFDIAGQLALKNAKVLIIGVGGLGSPVAMYLAAAGIGSLTIVDDDHVDVSNLQRQLLHRESSLGKMKVDSAKEMLSDINPHIDIHPIAKRLDFGALQNLVKDVDLVLDCSDSFTTRFLVNRVCVLESKPLVSGAAIRMEGQVSVFDMRDTEAPCYQCLYPDGDDEQLTCSTSGVMAPLVGIVGSMQAMEAIKVLSGLGQTLKGRLMMLDATSMEWRTLKLKKDPACCVCNCVD
jgi:adenylyltransferase/sulfurtransferase